MKKKTWVILGVVAVIIIFLVIQAQSAISNMQNSLPNQQEDTTVEKPEVTNEIVFTGKVSPKQSQEVYLDSSKVLNNTYVKVNDTVTTETVLLDYYGITSAKEKINIYNNDFIVLQENRDWYYTRIAELKDEISWTSEPLYLQSLKKELAEYEQALSQNKIDWVNKQDEIKRLQESLNDYSVCADFDGFVYQINEQTSAVSTSPYILIYSTERIVKIEVGEYELQYVDVGKEVEIEIEGLDKKYTGIITHIDIFPNNMDSNTTSYFNIEISIDAEVPYGYSAIIRVKTK